MPARNATHSFLAAILFLATFVAACGAPLQTAPSSTPSPKTLVFMTDFGVTDDSVAICKAVMLGIEPDLRVVDITHQVTPYSVLDGARFLMGATAYFKPGTVFVVVIDPGVGSTRKPLVVKSKRGQFFVLPDNGLITLVQNRDGIEGAREISNLEWMIGNALSSTFHGRDIFSSAGAHLVRGDDWTKVGPLVGDLVQLKTSAPSRNDKGITGEVVALDGPYGNLMTNVDGDEFRKLGYALGEKIKATVGEKSLELPFVRTFSDVPENAPLLYIDSRGHVGLAINMGNFAEVHGIKPSARIFLPHK